MTGRAARIRLAVIRHGSAVLISFQETGSLPATLLAVIAPPLMRTIGRLTINTHTQRIFR